MRRPAGDFPWSEIPVHQMTRCPSFRCIAVFHSPRVAHAAMTTSTNVRAYNRLLRLDISLLLRAAQDMKQ